MSYMIQIKYPEDKDWRDYQDGGYDFMRACANLKLVEKYTPHVTLDDLLLETITKETTPKPRLQIVWKRDSNGNGNRE